MRPDSHDLSFHCLGFPITIQPYFWLLAVLLMALNLGAIESMPLWTAQLLIGIVAILVSILVHELGHALTFRYLYHTPCTILIHGFGGATIPLGYRHRHYGFLGTLGECFLSFSGPLAGFILAFAFILILHALPQDDRFIPSLCTFFLWWTALISMIWGLFNLLPIYPMDGGHIAREFFAFMFPRQGIKYSLMFSMFLASLLAVVALRFGMFFATFLFAYFAFQNYQEMISRSFRY